MYDHDPLMALQISHISHSAKVQVLDDLRYRHLRDAARKKAVCDAPVNLELLEVQVHVQALQGLLHKAICVFIMPFNSAMSARPQAALWTTTSEQMYNLLGKCRATHSRCSTPSWVADQQARSSSR